MSQESWNIIIGALIGVIPSLLIAYFGYRFQSFQKERERSWHIEDLKRARDKEVTETRLNQAEKLIIENYNFAQYIKKIFGEAFSSEESYNQVMDEMVQKSNEMNTLLLFAYSLKIEELNKCIATILSEVGKIFRLVSDARAKQNQKGKLSEDELSIYKNPLLDSFDNISLTSRDAVLILDSKRKELF